MAAATAPEGRSTVVAVDRDKNGVHAVLWAMDHLTIHSPTLIILHVRTKSHAHGAFDKEELFGRFRGFYGRKGVHVEEVVIEETETARALLDYVKANLISNIVVGSSTRNAFARKFKNWDVSAAMLRSAPDFCSVYVISKGKVVQVRSALRPKGNVTAPPRQVSLPAGTVQPVTPNQNKLELEDRGCSLKVMPDQKVSDKSMDVSKSPVRDRLKGSWLNLREGINSPCVRPGIVSPNHPDGSSLNRAASGPVGPPSSSKNQKELEAEMKRLKMELKQTVDMYSTACKEAISAKQKAKELDMMKMEEARRVEEAKNAEEAARAIAEKEKAKCQAAIEAAESAQKLAEMEAQKRRDAELKAKRELEAKNQAITALAQNDLLCRKYTIDEIEEATNKFSESMKIGEGGYGPVFKGKLDHTPVAIKVLRPDAAQGRKQFQQEVEVLSTIRHPNMVLLLGACPEYGCLVYEYMENGSLKDCLLQKGNSPPLSWMNRVWIAAEIATALLFLHQAKPEPIVHRDLKPANILIDRNYVSKISDVGLARLVPASVADSVTQYHLTSAAGSFCYIDPEYQQTGRLTPKSDIYSLGITLLQIITAKPAMGISHHVSRAIVKGKFGEILDPTMTDCSMEEALAYGRLALQCAELSKKDRPDLGTVIVPELNRLRDLAESCSSPFSSPLSHTHIIPTSSESQGGTEKQRPETETEKEKTMAIENT